MKLNIYEKHEIVKTYEASQYSLLWGTVSEIINAVDIESFKTGSDEEIIRAVGKLMVTSRDVIEEFMLDIFEGLTREELKQAKVQEIARVIIDVVVYTVLELEATFGGVTGNFLKVSKNR